jgi:putative flippase GtrA
MIGDKHTTRGRVIRYGIAGVAAAALQFSVLTACVELAGLRPFVATAIATCVVIVFSYFVNRRWIFETNRSHTSAFTRFVAASAFSLALNTGLMYLIVDVIGWHYWAGFAISAVIAPVTNFIINQKWAFRNENRV